MLTEQPDFFIVSADQSDFENPRRAYRMRGITYANLEGLLIRIDLPLRGAEYGAATDIATVLVVPQHEGVTLSPVNRWPAFVYVLLPSVEISVEHDSLNKGDAVNVAWAALYKTEEDARAKVVR